MRYPTRGYQSVNRREAVRSAPHTLQDKTLIKKISSHPLTGGHTYQINQRAARSPQITARVREPKVLKSGCFDRTVSKRSVLAPEAF